MAAEVFISYSSQDQERVVKIADKLRTAGVSLWVDESGISAATLWSQEIAEAISSCKVLVLMVTPKSVASENVVKEVSLAAEQRKKILPVILEPTEIPKSLQYHLAGIQHLDVSDMSASESAEEILPALQRLLGLESDDVTAVAHGIERGKRKSYNFWADWRLYTLNILVGAVGVSVGWLSNLSNQKQTPEHAIPLSLPKRAEIIPETRSSIDPVGKALGLSRDGSTLIYTPNPFEGIRLRNLESGVETTLEGTDGFPGMSPTFSSDGSKVCFFKGGELMISALSGGATKIADIPIGYMQFRGIDWSEKGEIVFAQNGRPLTLLSEEGGEFRTLMNLGRNESHSWPQFLPGSKHILFVSGTSSPTGIVHSVEVVSADGLERKNLGIESSFARYSSSGHLLFLHGYDLVAKRFSLGQLKALAGRETVVRDIETSQTAACIDVSDNGTLVYLNRLRSNERTFVWTDNKGIPPKRITKHSWTGNGSSDLSPDDKRVALSVDGSISIIEWLSDRESERLIPLLPKEGSQDYNPIWAVDGRSIFFNSDLGGTNAVLQKFVDVPNSESILVYDSGDNKLFPLRATLDGNYLIVKRWGDSDEGATIHRLSIHDRILELLFSEPEESCCSTVSSDGNLLAYWSRQNEVPEVYVQSLSGTREVRLVEEGVYKPFWSRDGSDLFYLGSTKEARLRALFSSKVTLSKDKPIAGNSELFVTLPESLTWGFPMITRDKSKLVYHRDPDVVGKTIRPAFYNDSINIIFNFFTELNEKVPAGKE